MPCLRHFRSFTNGALFAQGISGLKRRGKYWYLLGAFPSPAHLNVVSGLVLALPSIHSELQVSFLESRPWRQLMSRWKRIAIWAGIIVFVGGVYVWFFGFQTANALMLRYQFRKQPDVAKTPVPLTDLSTSSVPHRTASYFGYEFELPADDVDKAKDKTFGTVHVSYFRSGNAFWFSTSPPKSFVNEVAKTGNLSPQDLKQLYGEDALESDFAFHKRMLYLTPAEITPFISRRQAISGQVLLMIKAICMPNAASGIFSIQTQDFKGFQFENPQSHPSSITVELFSNDDGVHLIFMQKAGAPPISQAEINRVIQSIHKATLQTASAPVNQSDQK